MALGGGNRLERKQADQKLNIFLGGNWIRSYSRTQKNVTLSSTEGEFVALVAEADVRVCCYELFYAISLVTAWS